MRSCRPCLLLLCLFMSACASPLPVDQAQAYMRDTLLAAKIRHSKGDNVQALILTDAVIRVDKNFPGAQQMRKSIAGMLGEVAAPRPWIGSNYALREPVERAWDQKIVSYIPDRILDLFDIVSFDVHVGPGVFGQAHLTRGLQLGGGYRTVGGIGLHEQRSLGGQTQYESRINLFTHGIQAFTGHKAGSTGVFATTGAGMGMEKPSDVVYQEFRDYWAIGGAFTAGVAGADVDFHPVQALDFIAGFFTIDFLNDDIASSRSLDFTRDESRLLLRVARLLRDPESIEAYYDAIMEQQRKLQERRNQQQPKKK